MTHVLLLRLAGAPGLGKSTLAVALLRRVHSLARAWHRASVTVCWVQVDCWRVPPTWRYGRRHAEQVARHLLVCRALPPAPVRDSRVRIAASVPPQHDDVAHALRIVVLDDVNSSVSARRSWLAEARKAGALVLELWLDASLNTVHALNIARGPSKRLPHAVISNEFHRVAAYRAALPSDTPFLPTVSLDNGQRPDIDLICASLISAAHKMCVASNHARVLVSPPSSPQSNEHLRDLELRRVVSQRLAACAPEARPALALRLRNLKRQVLTSDLSPQNAASRLWACA